MGITNPIPVTTTLLPKMLHLLQPGPGKNPY